MTLSLKHTFVQILYFAFCWEETKTRQSCRMIGLFSPRLKAWIRHSTRSCRVPSAHPRALIDSNQDKSGGQRCNSASCDTAQIQRVVHISEVTGVKTAHSWLSLVASLKHGRLGGYPFCCATPCAGRPVTLSLPPAGDNTLRHALLSCSWVVTLKGVTRLASYLDAAVKQ